jgi:WD40 repeat protein
MLRDGKKGYSSKADVWSVGCIFYELLVGERPFPDDLSVIQYADSKATLGIPQHILHTLDADWEPALTTLLKGSLQFDPHSRIPIVNLLRQFAFHYEQTCSDESLLYLSYRKYGLACNIGKRPIPFSSATWLCSNTPYFAELGDHNATIWKCEKGMSRTTAPKVGDPHERKQITEIALGKLRATGRVVIALSDVDSVIMVYDADTAVELTRYRALPRVTSLAIDHDGGHLAYGTHDGRIIILKIQNYLERVWLSQRPQIWVGTNLIVSLQFHSKPDTLICALTYSEVVVVNTFGTVFERFSREKLSVRHARPWIYTLWFNPVRDELLICTEDRIWIYDLSTADGRCRFIEAQDCRGAIYSPCGNYILATYRGITSMGV